MAKRHLKLVSPATVNRTLRPSGPPIRTSGHQSPAAGASGYSDRGLPIGIFHPVTNAGKASVVG